MDSLSPTFKPGDPLSADLINSIVRGLISSLDLKGGPGINARLSGNQIQITGASSSPPYIFKGKVATGGISARSSDSAHGTGNVEIWVKNPSTGAYVDSGNMVAVDYISSTTGGLSAGVWVNCGQQEDGTFEIISVDCGN